MIHNRSLSTTDVQSVDNIRRAKTSFSRQSTPSPSEQDEDCISYSGDSSSHSSLNSDRSLRRSHSSTNFREGIHDKIVEGFIFESTPPFYQYPNQHVHKGEFFFGNDQEPESFLSVYGKSVFSELKKNAKILDVGCGTGNFVEKMNEMGYDAEGIDAMPKPRLTKRQYENSKHITYGAAIEDTPLQKEHYDAIFSSRSLFSFLNSRLFSEEENKEEAKKIRVAGLKNMADGLKVGHKIHMLPVYNPEELHEIINEIPELEIVSKPFSIHPWTKHLTLIKKRRTESDSYEEKPLSRHGNRSDEVLDDLARVGVLGHGSVIEGETVPQDEGR